MTQSTTNLGKIHVFPSETLYNQFKDIIADNDLALLKDDGAYIVAARLEQNGFVKFSNGLLVQWGVNDKPQLTTTFPIAFTEQCYAVFPIGQYSGKDPIDGLYYCLKETTTTSFSIVGVYAGVTLNWFAIGR